MRERTVSRSDLRRALVVNALAGPVNVLVPTGVLIAGVLLGAWWLALVAVLCWLALAAHTFFDEREAKRVGARAHARRRATCASQRSRVSADVEPGALSPPIGARVKAAVGARAAIREAIDSTPFSLADVDREVDELVAALEADARRAQRINAFLAGQESAESLERRVALETDDSVRAALAAKQRAFARLRERLGRLMAQMDQVVATLQIVHAEIVSAEDVEERAMASQVSDLRAKVELVSAGLEEAFAETRVATRRT